MIYEKLRSTLTSHNITPSNFFLYNTIGNSYLTDIACGYLHLRSNITDTNVLEPDFLLSNPNLFKAVKKDADSLGIMEALTSSEREDFLQGMKNEIQELESHGTWTIMK